MPKLVTDEDNAMLTAFPNADEMKRSVFQMDPNSAPALNGFPGKFYQECWDRILLYLALLVMFSNSSEIPDSFQAYFITLISKEAGASTVSL